MELQDPDTVDTINTEEISGRNTKKSSARSRLFAWTLNNYNDVDIVNIETWGNEKCEYTFQEEIGKEGTKHLQGYFYFKNPRTWDYIKKEWNSMHIEKGKNLMACRNYCSKIETRNGKLYSNYIKEIKIKDPMENKIPFEWQMDILNLIKTEPDERSIYWYYDEEGGKGKTSLCKHICLKNKNALYLTGKSSDCKYGVLQAIENKIDPKIMIFDFCRSQEQYISYQAIEEVKNGIFYNTKYEAKMIIYNNPHVIIFANFQPEMEKLSLDRWKIININDVFE